MRFEKSPKNKIIGIDNSEWILSIAENKIKRNNIINLDLCLMDMMDLSLLPDKIDFAIISFALHEFTIKEQDLIFQNVSQLLKPGSQFLILDFFEFTN